MSFKTFWNRLIGRTVPINKYEYLEEKYNSLKIEFRRYREHHNLIELRLRREIKQLKKTDRYNSEIISIISPYIDLKPSDKKRIRELEDLKTQVFFD